MKKEQSKTPVEIISVESNIFIIRGIRVMLDFHLAHLYQVPTMRLNEQVKRNHERFPDDFIFKLTKEEFSLISQFAISKKGRGGRHQLPHAFTEHGVAMLSAVLRSDRAVAMSVFIVRAFVKLREALATNRELAHKIAEIEHIQ